MSARRLLVLVRGLANDPTSTFHRAVAGPWDLQSQLMAASVDSLRYANYLTARLNTPKGHDSPVAYPKPIARPGVKANNPENTITQGKTDLSPEEVAARLAAFNPPEE